MNRRLKALTFFLAVACALPVAVASSPDSTQICKRLATIEGQIPLPYHPSLAGDIQDCQSRPLPAEFAVYDSLITAELQQRQLPLELRYLPLALSQMNPNHDRGGRTGVWDLPVLPALRYGLTVNEHHDERYAVEAATKAALQYLSDLHAATGDWWTTLLAYTNSPATLNQVKARHPGVKIAPWDYKTKRWLDRPDIVGDFIACYYVYSSDDKAVAHNSEEIVTCDFDQPVSVAALSALTDLPKKIIVMLNPLFRSDPFLPLEPYGIRLPKSVATRFEAEKGQLYEETDLLSEKQAEEKAALAEKQEKTQEQSKAKAKSESKSKSITYVVKKGDTLNKIAKKYHVKVSDLKKWNKIKGDMIREKQKLKIYQ